MSGKKYRKVAVGGTFEKLHRGHEKLVDEAFEVGEFVVIGLTTDRMLGVYTKPHPVGSYNDRRRELLNYLTKKGFKSGFHITPIDDPYGSTLSDGEIEALVVSSETSGRALEINALREEKGLRPLKVIVIDMVLAEDAVPISTERIMRGEIDRDGRLLQPSKSE
jgi:pantetheine-phosphate adenylyltransferase